MFKGSYRKRLLEPTALRAPGRSRWAARIVSGFYAAFGLFLLLAHIFGDEDSASISEEPATVEGIFVGVVTIGMCLALISAWRWEGIGGIVTIVFGIAMAVLVMITAGRNQLIVATVNSGPVIASGVVFLKLALDRGSRDAGDLENGVE